MKFLINSLSELDVFASRLAKSVTTGDVIELIGDVGAGKTTFTKAFAKAIGVEDTVQSPTFTISQRYKFGNNNILAHYDFYRLDDAGIMKNELAETILSKNVITVIEWADSVHGVLPDKHIRITFIPKSETVREVILDNIVLKGE